jgi:replication factor C large subunit
LRENCELLQFRRINIFSILRKLKQICASEGLDVSDEVLESIAGNSNGDIRSAINDLQIVTANRKKVTTVEIIGFRERSINVFETLKMIFKSNDVKEAMRAIDYCDKDIEELFWWIEQNIVNEYRDPEQIALAYDILSRADIFREKVYVGKNYRMLMYMKNMIASIALIRKDSSYTSYKPPERLIILGRTKSDRAEDDETYGDLAQELHCSKRCVKNQMPFLKVITSN